MKAILSVSFIHTIAQRVFAYQRERKISNIRRNVALAVSLLPFLFVTNFSSAAQEVVANFADWNFDVYIDDKRVGTHRFQVSEKNGQKRVQSDADFEYKFLFITAYRYEHSASELWANNCLANIKSSTNANGKRISVVGRQTGSGFSIEQEDKPVTLPDCVHITRPDSYSSLNQSKLLNPQTGEYLDVDVEKIGEEMRNIRGEQVVATRFKLTAREVDVTLWYSSSDEWLALESVAKGGRIIRYELS